MKRENLFSWKKILIIIIFIFLILLVLFISWKKILIEKNDSLNSESEIVSKASNSADNVIILKTAEVNKITNENNKLTAIYSLPIEFVNFADSFSFDYKFIEMSIPSDLLVEIEYNNEKMPLWTMRSETFKGASESGLISDFDNSGLINGYESLVGKKVILRFILTSREPGAGVILKNLTLYSSPQARNKAPIANAGPDQLVKAGSNGLAKISLDGSKTIDTEGDDLSYVWLNQEGYLLGDGQKVEFELPKGKYVIKLVVRDTVDNVGEDEVVVEVV